MKSPVSQAKEMLSMYRTLQEINHAREMYPLVERGEQLKQKKGQLDYIQAKRNLEKQEFDTVLNRYSDMITDEGTSVAQASNLKAILGGWVQSQPEWLRVAAGPALMHSPLSKMEAMKDRFRKMFPTPSVPKDKDGGLLAEGADTRNAWATYSVKKAEHNLNYEIFRRKAMGMPTDSLKAPVFTPAGDDSNIWYYRDPTTRQIGHLNKQDLPQEELMEAIEKYGATLPGMMNSGAVPLGPRTNMIIGDEHYSVRPYRSFLNGQVMFDREAIGPKPGSGSKFRQAPAGLQKALMVANTGKGKDAIGNDSVALGIINSLETIKDNPSSTEARQTLVDLNKQLVSSTGFFIGAPKLKKNESLLNWLPGVNKVVIDGPFVAVEVDGMRKFVDGEHNSRLFYHDSKTGRVFTPDAREVKNARGKPEGAVITDRFGGKGKKLPEQIVKKKKGITLREAVTDLEKTKRVASAAEGEVTGYVIDLLKKYGNLESNDPAEVQVATTKALKKLAGESTAKAKAAYLWLLQHNFAGIGVRFAGNIFKALGDMEVLDGGD